MLYDADILEEKVLLEWGVKVSKKYVSRELSQEIHAKAEPFITWLREAEEEEESSEDEEEDDLEVSYICVDFLTEYYSKKTFIGRLLSSKGKSRNFTHNQELMVWSGLKFAMGERLWLQQLWVTESFQPNTYVHLFI